MSLGTLFLVLALIFYFVAGTGFLAFPGAMAWGSFCLTLSFLLGGINVPLGR
jgi:hypothetical protein